MAWFISFYFIFNGEALEITNHQLLLVFDKCQVLCKLCLNLKFNLDIQVRLLDTKSKNT